MTGRRLGAIAVAVLICTGLGACADRAQPEYIGNFEFTPENYPRMGGSLAALPLGEAVTAAALGIDRGQTGDFILFEGSTTRNYMALVSNSFDMLLAYEPSEEAVQYAREQGFEWEMAPIGRDALVFITNKSNPVQGLTDEQIRGIYKGEITNWSEVGGDDAAIIPYQRNNDSGSQTLFDKLINLGDDLMKPPPAYVVGSMIGLLEVVAEYDNSADALGYTVYYYLANMEKEKLERSKILAVDGVECSNGTIRSGKYPYVNDFYAVIPKSLPEDAPARVLYNWIRSAQGKELIESENYVVP
ncbi:MAG: substrate-binding domain-containing protein [Clostridiales bacterium]|nr:substrate-binding domain-containing protein [Clostridiales bacterium]